MSPASPVGPAAAPRSKTELFLAFNSLSLQGFGGVLAIAQRDLVERRRWLTREQFVELLSIGQVLPGPNIVNMALMLGDRFFGVAGAIAALAGMLLVPLAIVLALAAAYAEFSRIDVVAGALRGIGVVAAGLVVATAVRLMGPLAGSRLGRPAAALLVLATIATVAWLRWPLVWVIAGLGTLAVGAAWWRLGR